MGSCRQECTRVCEIFVVFLRFMVAFAAIGSSIVALTECEFLHYVRQADQKTFPPLLGPNTTEAKVGLFKWNPDDGGCRSVPSNAISVELQVARIAGAIAIGIAACAIAIMWIEYLLCRFTGSRCINSTLFVISTVAQSLTFLIFSSDICSPKENSDTYPCSADSGAVASIVAAALYFFCAVLVCCSIKPEPVCKRLREKDETDPCVCPPWKRERDEDDEDKLEELENGEEEKYPYPLPQSGDEASSVSYAASDRSPYGYARAPLPPYGGLVDIVEGDIFFDTEDEKE